MRRAIKTWFDRLDHREALGWALLALAAVGGLVTIRWGISDVEADALVTGLRMGRGEILYRDVFSHHFPFAYFWSAISVGLFGKSIYLTRVSIWLFQLFVLGAAMVLTRYYLTIGITGLIWSILRHLYSTNMFVYQVFSAAAIIGIAALVLFVILEEEKSDFRHALGIALLASVSVLSDPLTIYPVGFALLLLWFKSPRIGLRVTLIVSGCAAVFLGYLLLTGSLSVFLSDTVTFNAEIYARYNNNFASPIRFSRFFDQFFTGLGIANRQFLNLNPFREITTQYTAFDRWLFTGFLYRLGVLLGVAAFLYRRKYFAAFFLYTYTAAALAIDIWGPHGVNFVSLAVFGVAGQVSQEWWPPTEDRPGAVLRHAGRVLSGAMAAWLCFRVIEFTVSNFSAYSYIRPLINYQAEAEELVELTCGEQDVLLGYYPSRIYPYFFSEMQAVSGYYYMWPWVAEVALPDVIDELDRDDTLAVVNRRNNGLIFEQYSTYDYLKPLDDYLMDNYVRIEQGLYISPALADRCETRSALRQPDPIARYP